MRRRLAGALGVVTVLVGGVLGVVPPASAHTPHDNIVAVAVSPEFAKDRTVYTISREYLLESRDSGDTWRRLNRGLDNKAVLSALVVGAHDPKRMYTASRGDGVYRSDDGGRNWRRMTLPQGGGDVMGLFASPHDEDVLMLTHPILGAEVSHDGGRSWRSIDAFAGQMVKRISFDPANPDVAWAGAGSRLFRTTDRGVNWSQVADGVGQAEVRAQVVVPEAKGSTVLVGTSNGLFRLEGTRLVRVRAQPGDGNLTALASLGGTDVVAVVWGLGAFVSNDAGSTWKRDTEGLTTTQMAADLGHPDFSAVAVAGGAGSQRTMFLAGYDGLFRSKRAGGWEEVQTQDAMNLTAIDISPNFVKDGSLLVTSYINGPKLTADRGRTWTSMVDGVAFEHDYLRRPDYYVRLTDSVFTPDFAKTGRMYTMTRGYFFSTSSPTEPWTAQVVNALVDPKDFPPDYLLPSFSPDYARDRSLYAGTDSGLVLRRVGEQQFERIADIGIEIKAFVVSPSFADDRTLFAATSDGLYVGKVGAKTELTLRKGSPRKIISLAVSPTVVTDGTIMAGTENGLFVSHDTGRTWDEVPWSGGAQHPYVESVVMSPSFATDGVLLVSERGHGLFRSVDGGVTWKATGAGLFADDVVLSSFYHRTGEPIVFSPDFAHDRTIFGTAQTTLYRSTDAGDTWTAIHPPRKTHPMTVESAPNRLLNYPGADDAHDHPAARFEPAARSGRTVARPLVTPRRLVVALLAAAFVFVAMSVLNFERRLPAKVLVLLFRAGCAAGAFLLVVLAASRRH